MKVSVELWGPMDLPNLCLSRNPDGWLCAMTRNHAGGHAWGLRDDPKYWPELRVLIGKVSLEDGGSVPEAPERDPE